MFFSCVHLEGECPKAKMAKIGTSKIAKSIEIAGFLKI